MALDQSKVGQHIAEQMEAIEADFGEKEGTGRSATSARSSRCAGPKAAGCGCAAAPALPMRRLG